MSGSIIILQRRSSKIEVQLASFSTFSAFEEHVGSKFEIDQGAKFVVTDFDRERVIDDELYGEMRSGEYWRRDPKANRLFLVLDDISAPLEGDVELEVSYQPHFNTITKTGDANFSKIPHAVAELIDNSIQATNLNTGSRMVEVEVELGGRGASFLVIRDNGRGMNASGLKDFATYFLTQENRGVSGPQGSSTPALGTQNSNGSQSSQSIGSGGGGEDRGGGGGGGGGGRKGGGSQVANGKGKGSASTSARRETGNFVRGKGSICSGFISKFGVGALQAGFYIGSCLTVVTKTASRPDVYEFVMNEAEFERRAESNAAMFKDKIKLRNAGKGKTEDPEAERNGPSKELMDRLRGEESGKDHFTYIVLTLRNQHVEWFADHEKGFLKKELASMYHYYLHPEHCPDGIRRDDGSTNGSDAGEEGGSGGGGGGGGGGSGGGGGEGASKASLEIVFTERNRNGQVAERTPLSEIDDDLESRLNSEPKASFLFQMEVLHPMQNPRTDAKRLPVTGVIHYYPYDGDKETRPQLWADEEDDESTTIEAFWEGRLVPESHAAAMSFFPLPKLKKKEREALGANWKRRIKGMLFFDWHFPISNNKLKLQFNEGDLHSALNAKNVPPKHPAVIYPGTRGRHIEKDFRDWLVKCHETLDIEYRFDDKIPSGSNSKYDKWRRMTFGKGGATFVGDSRVKLPFMKPNVYGVINYFITEVDEEEEEGRGVGKFSLQRAPADIFGEDDASAKLYPVTELDPVKSVMSDDDWDKAMMAYRKLLPASTQVVMVGSDRPLPKRLTVRVGKAEVTKVMVQILDGNKKVLVQIPQGAALRVHSILEKSTGRGTYEPAMPSKCAKPFADRRFEKMFFFDPMTFKEPGEYRWTVAVAKEGAALDTKDARLLVVMCTITVLPGNPTKLVLEGEDWETNVPIGDPCWLPAFDVKLRDMSKCVCPMRAYKSVKVTCSEEGAFDVLHASSSSSTHQMGRLMSEGDGPLEYDEHAWKLVPKRTGLLSAEAYERRTVGFEVTVVAHMQQDRQQDNDEEEFKSTFGLKFEPGRPSELMLLEPGAKDGGSVVTIEAGAKLPAFEFATMDANGNRTAPLHNETWKVTLDVAAATEGASDEEVPEFSGTAVEKVAEGLVTFGNLVVKWDKPLKKEGELVVVEATLRTGSGKKGVRETEMASASFRVRVKPNKNPVRAVVCLNGKPWGAIPGGAGQGGGAAARASPRASPKASAAAAAAAAVAAEEAEAGEGGATRVCVAGSVISGLHVKLYDQGGAEVVVGKKTFEASNNDAVTCSWETSWHWPAAGAGGGKGKAGGGGYDRLPDLKVPTQLSRLEGGIHHAKVTVKPRGVDGGTATTLSATFALDVHAGPVARWMAVRADNGKISENPGPLELTSGCKDAKMCNAAFAKVVKGFLPVDEYGNLVKDSMRAPEITLEGMPSTTLMPEGRCRLAKPAKPGGLFHFPRALNLIGPPSEGGSLLIASPSGALGEGGALENGVEHLGAGAGAGAAEAGGGVGGGGNAGGGEVRVLRLAVSIKAGPPVKLLIRSPKLGAEEYSSEIWATQLAGFKVTDLEVSLVDASGNGASLPTRGVKITVSRREDGPNHGSASSSGAASTPSRGGGGRKNPAASPARKDLSKRATHEPVLVMPRFVLDMKVQDPSRGGTPAGVSPMGRGAAQRAATAAAERAARIAEQGLELVVRVEGGPELEGVEEACIRWMRLRTAAVTKVNLATISALSDGSGGGGRGQQMALEEPVPLGVVMGQRGRRRGVIRSVDGPLPTLVVWLDTDNETPFVPPAETVTFSITNLGGPAGSRTLSNLYELPVSAPECIDRPNAQIFKPKGDAMEQNVGEHTITCMYVERRNVPGTQGEEEEKVAEMALRIVAGAPARMEPMADDANLFHSLSASNQTSTDPDDEVAKNARQLVEKTFRFTANDCKGNLAGQINGPVRMRIENLDGVDVPEAEMPRLEASDEEGYVEADPTATGVFLFEENWLMGGVGSREGDYKLVVDSAGDPEVAPWSTQFHFDTDQKRLDAIREVNSRLKPLEKKMERFNLDLNAAALKEEASRRQVIGVMNELPGSLASQINVDSEDLAACMRETQRLLHTFEAEQRDRHAHRARPLKFEGGRMPPAEEQRIKPVGYIAELGYVEDEAHAKLLSMKAGGKMKAVYVDTKAQLDKVRRARAGGFCKETIINFRVPGANRPRNAAEIAQKRLPLRDIRERGFIDYLVNMIQLPDHHEELRDTVFSALYGTMVMFDTHDNAHEYKKNCKHNGQLPLPILVKEDGTSLERTGYMPPAKDPDCLDRLRIIYGAMPATLSPEYAITERYTRLLKSLMPALEHLRHAEEDLDAVQQENDVDSWRSDISALKAELETLVSHGGMGSGKRRGKGRGGSAGAGSGRRGSAGGGGESGAKRSRKKKEAETTPRGRSAKRPRR